jgi:hypothetical protein
MIKSKRKIYLPTDFEKFIVIGNYYNSKRKFRITFTDFNRANQINLWNGRIWGVLKETKKKVLLKTVIN